MIYLSVFCLQVACFQTIVFVLGPCVLLKKDTKSSLTSQPYIIVAGVCYLLWIFLSKFSFLYCNLSVHIQYCRICLIRAAYPASLCKQKIMWLPWYKCIFQHSKAGYRLLDPFFQVVSRLLLRPLLHLRFYVFIG